MLDGLGLGPNGPPIPPPASFSVVPYPVKRKPPSTEPGIHYQFVSSSPDDPNIAVEERPKEPSESALGDDTIPLDTASRAESKKDEYPPPSSRKSRKDRIESSRTPGRRSSPRRSRRGSITSPPLPTTPGSEMEQGSIVGDTASTYGTTDYKGIKLSHFRYRQLRS